MSRPLLLVSALLTVSAVACLPKARGPSTVEEAPSQASGALASAPVVVDGDADAKYKGALADALGHSGVHVSSDVPVAGLHVVLHVKGPTFEEAAEDDDSPTSYNVANYDVQVLVQQRGATVEVFSDKPQFDLEELAGTTVIRNVMTKDEADAMFRARVMTHFANQIVGSPNVASAAQRAVASR
jgi:hypothetical protein